MAASANQGLDNTPRMRRIIQAVLDLRGGDLDGARILDLGSAHGFYTLEFARRGAECLGIEGRTAWVQHADTARDAQQLSRASFRLGDVREIDIDDIGKFDVTLCLGLLYHLRAHEAADLLQKLYDVTNNFLIVDTQIALTPAELRTLRDKDYYGHDFPEHPADASPEAMEADLGASLDTTESFWFTQSSLINLLGDVGFSSVFEIKWPMDHMYMDGELRVHDDYVTVVAFKGSRITEVLGLEPQSGPLERFPEDLSAHLLKRPHAGFRPKVEGISEAPASPVAANPRPPFLSRLANAARVLRGRP